MNSESVKFEERPSAHSRRLRTFAIVNLLNEDYVPFFDNAYPLFDFHINKVLEKTPAIKVYAEFEAEYIKETELQNGSDMQECSMTLHVTCKTKLIDGDSILITWYEENIKNVVLARVEEFEACGSGWTLAAITELSVNCNRYIGFHGRSYIKLPSYIENKKAVINVRNRDNECFRWAVLSALHEPKTNKGRVSNYETYRNELNFYQIKFPMDVSKIKRFEQLNPDISINVYILNDNKNYCDDDDDNAWDDGDTDSSKHEKRVEPLRLTSNVKRIHVDLLLMHETIGDITISHYCWIKNLSALIRLQITKNNRKLYFCRRCLHYFISENLLIIHANDCKGQNECAIILPSKENNILKFENHKNQLRAPFCIYADIECMLSKPENETFDNGGKTKAYQEHTPFSVGYYFKSDLDYPKSYYATKRGSDCIKWFVEELYKIYQAVQPVFDTIIDIEMTLEEEQSFQLATHCHICEGELSYDDRVRDHDHFRGNYRGPAHNKCNLLYQESRNIPIIFHNMTHYDGHLIIREIASSFKGNISIIPVNDQTYISFTKDVKDSIGRKSARGRLLKNIIRFKFIDSFRFMASSLDKLVSF